MTIGCCVLEYLYRDGGNWKTWGAILLSGDLPDGSREELLSYFEVDGLFVAEQIGVASLCKQHFEHYGGPTELDHAFHEFFDLRSATPDEITSMSCVESLACLIARTRLASNRWDVRYSPNVSL